MNNAVFDIEQLRPEHKICETTVNVPTIIVEPLTEDCEPEVFVQWFADFSSEDVLRRQFGDALINRFKQMQFRFPVPLAPENQHWMGHPEFFKVVLVGQVTDWPNKEAIPEFGDPNQWILWVTSAHYGFEDGPACFAVPLIAMLADGLCGIITPRIYCDVDVLDREVQSYNDRTSLYS